MRRFGVGVRVLMGMLVVVVLGVVVVQTVRVSAAVSYAPVLRLPWLDGAYGIAGYSYGCGGHIDAGGNYRDSYALDFGLPDRTQLAAVARGIIHYGYDGATRDYGHYLYIVHTNENWLPLGYVSVYAHLGRPNDRDTGYLRNLPEGAHVLQGQFIGYSGYSGKAFGPHLHYSLRKNAYGIADGEPAVPEPMSGYSGFKHYGITSDLGKAPANCGSATSPLYSSANALLNQTLLNVQIDLPGAIGLTGNRRPEHTQRLLTVDVTSTSKRLFSFVVPVVYESKSGVFSGVINLGSTFPTDSYTVRIKLANTLRKVVVSKVSIIRGGATILPLTSLTVGDINGDNALNDLDYTVLVNCYGARAGTSSCRDKTAPDLNDDDTVNSSDYHIFLRAPQQRGD